MPMFWPVVRKGFTFVKRPSPGPHPKSNCIPLHVLVRDYLGLARNQAEIKRVLNSGAVIVDKQVRKDRGFPIGFMDIVEIPNASLSFRITMDSHGLALSPIETGETGKKYCRVQQKRTVNGGIQTISLHDGRNIRLEKNAKIRPGDTVVISLPGQKIEKHFAITEGSTAMIYAGRNKGMVGTIKTIRRRTNMLETAAVILETAKGLVETPLDYVMAGDFTVSEPAKTEPAGERKEKKPRKKKTEEPEKAGEAERAGEAA